MDFLKSLLSTNFVAMEFVVFIVIVFVVIFSIFAKQKQKASIKWIEAGNDVGLTFHNRGRPELFGVFHGRKVKIGIPADSPSYDAHTRFEVQYTHILKTGFLLTRQEASDGSYPGMQDIVVGDPEFDKQVIVRGRDEGATFEYFQNEKVRFACLDVIKQYGYTKVKVSNQVITVSLRGKISDAREIRKTLAHLVSIANILETEDATFELAESEVAPVKPPPLPQRKAKPTVPEERHEVVEPTVAKTESPVSAPEPIVEEMAEPQTQQVEAEVESVVEEFAPVEVASSLALGDVTGVLFEENLGRYAAVSRFDQLLKGEEVRWKCVLESILPGETDRVFGRGSGWIAVFELGSFPGMESGTGPFRLKYRIGRERHAVLDGLKGSKVEIAGRLLKYDPFSTTLYIDSEDAEADESSQSYVTESMQYTSYADKMKAEALDRPGEVNAF